jgi:hypothetical protein
MGVDNYTATLKLTPVTDGPRTFAEWSAEFDCDPGRERELLEIIGNGVFPGRFRCAQTRDCADAAEGRALGHHRRADRAGLGRAA